MQMFQNPDIATLHLTPEGSQDAQSPMRCNRILTCRCILCVWVACKLLSALRVCKSWQTFIRVSIIFHIKKRNLHLLSTCHGNDEKFLEYNYIRLYWTCLFIRHKIIGAKIFLPLAFVIENHLVFCLLGVLIPLTMIYDARYCTRRKIWVSITLLRAFAMPAMLQYE